MHHYCQTKHTRTPHENPLGGSVEKFYLSIYCHASLLQFLAFDSFLLWRICRSHGETTESKEKHWQIKNAAAPRSLQSRINSRVRGGNFYRQLGLSIIIMLSNKITVMSALLALRSLSLPCLNSIIQYHVLLHPSCWPKVIITLGWAWKARGNFRLFSTVVTTIKMMCSLH